MRNTQGFIGLGLSAAIVAMLTGGCNRESEIHEAGSRKDLSEIVQTDTTSQEHISAMSPKERFEHYYALGKQNYRSGDNLHFSEAQMYFQTAIQVAQAHPNEIDLARVIDAKFSLATTYFLTQEKNMGEALQIHRQLIDEIEHSGVRRNFLYDLYMHLGNMYFNDSADPNGRFNSYSSYVDAILHNNNIDERLGAWKEFIGKFHLPDIQQLGAKDSRTRPQTERRTFAGIVDGANYSLSFQPIRSGNPERQKAQELVKIYR
jgi:hypothetical protein